MSRHLDRLRQIMVSLLTDCASDGHRFLTVGLLYMTLLGVKPDRDPFPGVSSIHLEASLLEEPLTFLLRAQARTLCVPSPCCTPEPSDDFLSFLLHMTVGQCLVGEAQSGCSFCWVMLSYLIEPLLPRGVLQAAVFLPVKVPRPTFCMTWPCLF